MGCNWRLEFWVEDCSLEDKDKIDKHLTDEKLDFQDEGDYFDVVIYASYGFSVTAWVKEYHPMLQKMKGLRIYQYCLEQEADEVFEVEE